MLINNIIISLHSLWYHIVIQLTFMPTDIIQQSFRTLLSNNPFLLYIKQDSSLISYAITSDNKISGHPQCHF